MQTRVTQKSVAFAQPFRVAQAGRDLPAGPYLVTTQEEEILGLSFLAWRRVSTRLHWCGDARFDAPREWVLVTPTEIDAALLKDRGLLENETPPP